MIDTEVLRNKVIDLAIQGKLTQQLPEDGNAEDLYAQIQEDRTNLIKDGKIKKEKPLPEITEDMIPFDIAENWKWVYLGNLAQVYGGKRIPAGRSLITENTGHKYIRVSDMKNRTVLLDNLLFVPVDIYPTISKYIINKEDVYITVAGTIGKVGKIPPEIDGINLTENADRIVFTQIDQDWLIWCLSTSFIRRQIEMVTTQVAQPKLAIRRIQEFVIPLPPLEEQKRIVSILNGAFELLDIIDTLQQQYESDREILKGKIIDAGIRGKLTKQLPEDGNADELYAQIQREKARLVKEGKIKKEKPLPEISDDEIPFEIPSNWTWIRWGDLSERIQYGYNAPAKQAGRIKMVRISDIQEGEVQWSAVPYCDIDESEIENYLLHENDILFARTGGTVGKSYIVSVVPEEAVYAGYLIRTSYSSRICAQYMKYFMDSSLYWKQLRQGTIATAQPNCNGQTLSKMIVPFPPYEEQKRIASKIETIYGIIY